MTSSERIANGSARRIPDLGVDAFRKSQPDLAAPDIEMQLAPSAAGHMFSDQRDIPRCEPAVRVLDIARPDVHAAAFPGLEHIGAAEELGLVRRGLRLGPLDVRRKSAKASSA